MGRWQMAGAFGLFDLQDDGRLSQDDLQAGLKEVGLRKQYEIVHAACRAAAEAAGSTFDANNRPFNPAAACTCRLRLPPDA